jgi:pyridoxamine 5'-phosphate oxidase
MTMIVDTTDPIALFQLWWQEAQNLPREIMREPGAMSLATCNVRGHPSARMVLLKQVSEAGFTFYTNMKSRKGEEILANPHVSLCLYWMPLGRQIRIDGVAELVSASESDAYFASRPYESQVGAWASPQSQPLTDVATLQEEFAACATRFADGPIPRPQEWQGVRVLPLHIEFWQEEVHRLHQRHCFSRANINTPWFLQLLYP